MVAYRFVPAMGRFAYPDRLLRGHSPGTLLNARPWLGLKDFLRHTHIPGMSRAFINEDHFVEDLPDRPISEHPNLVTENGLRLIDAALQTARRDYGEAQAAGDRRALASAGRDLRYWSARRASAQIVSINPDNAAVQFGNTVTII